MRWGPLPVRADINRVAGDTSGPAVTTATQVAPAPGLAGGASPAILGATQILSLAAAPTFAIMALLSGPLGGDAPAFLCFATAGASPLGGMVPMYLLMSLFHAGPWLRLVAADRPHP